MQVLRKRYWETNLLWNSCKIILTWKRCNFKKNWIILKYNHYSKLVKKLSFYQRKIPFPLLFIILCMTETPWGKFRVFTIYLYLYLNIYAIMKTMFSPGYHHNGFVATHTLGHMMYGFSVTALQSLCFQVKGPIAKV